MFGNQKESYRTFPWNSSQDGMLTSHPFITNVDKLDKLDIQN